MSGTNLVIEGAKKALPGVRWWAGPAGVAGAAGLDYLQNPKARYPFDPEGGHGNQRWRYGNAAINSIFLTMAPFLHHNPAAMYGALSSPFIKDTLVAAMPTMESMRRDADTRRKSMGAALGIGAGALGLGGLATAKYLAAKNREMGGKVRVTLPTKDPNDRETEVEMPLDDVDISPAQRERLSRDVRKRVRSETRERTLKLDPETHKLIPFADWKARYGKGRTEEEVKVASDRLTNIVSIANNLWK